MDMKLIRLQEWKKQRRRSPEERLMDYKLEQLIDIIDSLEERIQSLEDRQLKLVRALNELLSRLETEE